MKLLLLSDAHANIDALRAVERAEPKVDLTVFLGDFVDNGFHPREVLDWFAARPHIAIRGNHDNDLLRYYALPERQKSGEETSFMMQNLNALADADVERIAAYPEEATFEADGIVYYLRHYEPINYVRAFSEEGTADFEALWGRLVPGAPPAKRRILLGHTHIATAIDYGNGRMLLNPGSVSFRKAFRRGEDAEMFGADYMVIEDGEVSLRHVDYPTAHLREMLKKTHYDPYFLSIAEAYFSSFVD